MIIAYCFSAYANQVIHNEKVIACHKLPVNSSLHLLNSLLRYLVVSNSFRLAHLPADGHISCKSWWQVDSWLVVFSVTIINHKLIDAAARDLPTLILYF